MHLPDVAYVDASIPKSARWSMGEVRVQSQDCDLMATLHQTTRKAGIAQPGWTLEAHGQQKNDLHGFSTLLALKAL
jgi:hypothetical protein